MKKRITELKSQQPIRGLPGEPKISIIIPVFNNVELTRQCLEALCANTRYPNYEVIIIDNGSTDTTGNLLSTLSGNIKIIKNKQNLGFSKANNQGAQAAEGKYLVFLNNDTEVIEGGWLEAMLEMIQVPGVAVARSSPISYIHRPSRPAWVVLPAQHKVNGVSGTRT